MRSHYDLIVIGAGSGGLAAAKKAAYYGASVALVENDLIGGTCVNVGCVPKKMMWYAGEFAELYRHAADYGFEWQHKKLDFLKLVTNRQQYIETLRQLYKTQLEQSGIDFIKGSACFLDQHTIQIYNYTCKSTHIIVATGCSPARPTITGADHSIDSNGFFALQKLPDSIVIAGAGYIAVELATILHLLGSKVRLLLRYNKPLRHFDTMISDSIMEIMKTQGIEILPNHEITEIVKNGNSQFTVRCHGHPDITGIDSVLFAIGRVPRTSSLNLSAAGVETDDAGFIITDKFASTNVDHIYAIGDVTGKKLLTPVAIAAGRALAERVFGADKNACLDYENIPTVIFSHPPAGSTGLSEEEAIVKYGQDRIMIHQTRFTPLFYALGSDKITSRMKLITLKPDEKIIGCHIVGLGADEILQGFAVAIKMGATKKDLDQTVAIHPTSAEELVTMK